MFQINIPTLDELKKLYESSPGCIQNCPGCKNPKARTTCCACGCGNCIECGYRFSCIPLSTDFLQSSQPIKFEPIEIEIPNKMLKMKYKKLDPQATAPKKAKEKDAGFDLHALADISIPSLPRRLLKLLVDYLPNTFSFIFSKKELQEPWQEIISTKIPTGIALEIPTNHVGLICDRSGLGSKALKTFGGVIDETYRGDVTVCLMNFSFFDYEVKAGDRIAQILILPVASPELEEVQELSSSERGTAGFGSTGVRNVKEFHE